jgi:hypothetical protein
VLELADGVGVVELKSSTEVMWQPAMLAISAFPEFIWGVSGKFLTLFLFYHSLFALFALLHLIHHPMSHRCIFCGKSCLRLQGLNEHIRAKHRTNISPEEKKKFANLFTTTSHPGLNGKLT